jgi:magnesium transporter
MRALSAANAGEVADCRARGEPFWLDIEGAGLSTELKGLEDALGVSPDVISSLTEFGQRPRLTRHVDHALLVFYGARSDAGGNAEPLEVHILLAPGELVTAHPRPVPAIVELREGEGEELDSRPAAEQLLARLTDSLAAVLEAIDDEVDELEDAIIADPTDAQLRRLIELRRALIELRRIATPQRDLALREHDALGALPGLSAAAVRELQAQLVMTRDVIDSMRELVTGALDLHQSRISTRLSATGDRLALIATVVLPLAVVTGFFGQNFGWLVQRIDTFAAFALLGLLAPLLVAAGLVYILRRRGYL